MKYLFSLILVVLTLPAYAEGKLVFAIDIIRHGDRTPIKEIPGAPYLWPQGLGELTPTGMNQEFKLGQGFRSLYIDKYHLLPESYVSNSIYVRSSDYNRTLMSAEAVLLGLYPLGSGASLPGSTLPALPMFYQPIPIHSLPQGEDSLLIPKQNGQSFESAVNSVHQSKAWQEQFNRYRKDLLRWSKLSGMPLTELQQIAPLGNTLYIRSLYGIPLPKGISQIDADKIIKLGRWVSVTTYQAYPVGYIGSVQLISTILDYLQSARETNSPLKYVLFSAHDSTLMAVMSGLKVPLAETPPYASDLKILLFKDNDDYLVELIYNGREIVIPGCSSRLCKLEEFSKLYKH